MIRGVISVNIHLQADSTLEWRLDMGGLARRVQVARPSPYPLRQPHLVEGRRVE